MNARRRIDWQQVRALLVDLFDCMLAAAIPVLALAAMVYVVGTMTPRGAL